MAMISAAEILLSRSPVVLERAAQAGRGEAEDDEDGREAGDEDEAGGEHLPPAGSLDLARRDAGDRREVAGNEGEHAGGEERHKPRGERREDRDARGGIGLHWWDSGERALAAINARPWFLRMPMRETHGCVVDDPRLASLSVPGRRFMDERWQTSAAAFIPLGPPRWLSFAVVFRSVRATATAAVDRFGRAARGRLRRRRRRRPHLRGRAARLPDRGGADGGGLGPEFECEPRQRVARFPGDVRRRRDRRRDRRRERREGRTHRRRRAGCQGELRGRPGRGREGDRTRSSSSSASPLRSSASRSRPAPAEPLGAALSPCASRCARAACRRRCPPRRTWSSGRSPSAPAMRADAAARATPGSRASAPRDSPPPRTASRRPP